MPHMKITDLKLTEYKGLRLGQNIGSITSMINEGDAGDIVLYTGFAVNGVYIPDSIQTVRIDQISAGEPLSPMSFNKVTDGVMVAVNKGYDVVFLANVEPGNRVSMSVSFDKQAPTVSGKEYVFEFSKPIPQTAYIVSLLNKLLKVLGGKRVYIENETKIVVVQ